MTTLSFMIDYHIGKGSPFPFHLTNIILHTCNTLLLFFVIRKLCGDIRVAVIAGLIFSVNPIHIESIAWISSRKDLLYAFFYLTSLYFYINYIEKSGKSGYWLSLLAFTFSSLSKVQAVTLPLLLFILDFVKTRKTDIKTILEKIPFFFIAILVGIINIYAQKGYGYLGYGNDFSLLEKLFLILLSLSQYLFKTVMPVSWSIFYPYPFLPGQSVPFKLYLTIFLFIGIIVLIAYLRKYGKRILIFGILFYIINIVTVFPATFHRDSIIAERYLYLGSIGIILMISFLSVWLMDHYQKLKIPVAVFMSAYIIFLSISCFTRNKIWGNQIALFEHALLKYPDSDIILNTLGSLEIQADKYPLAIQHLDKAIKLSPGYCEAYYNRGVAYDKTGQYELAISDFSSAINQNPNYDEAYFARGNVFKKVSSFNLALNDYSQTLKINNFHLGALQNRAIVKGYLDDFRGAVDDLNNAIAIDPGNSTCYYLRGIALFELGYDGCPDLLKALEMGYSTAERALEHYCR
ncbi:MAG: tetratricopeptide repeat protein [Bacteroidota bacterium]|nr:tetratricopeptide repeat protein [Bacteroidota bacterium]